MVASHTHSGAQAATQGLIINEIVPDIGAFVG
jgi:hypothetical protein